MKLSGNICKNQSEFFTYFSQQMFRWYRVISIILLILPNYSFQFYLHNINYT